MGLSQRYGLSRRFSSRGLSTLELGEPERSCHHSMGQRGEEKHSHDTGSRNLGNSSCRNPVFSFFGQCTYYVTSLTYVCHLPARGESRPFAQNLLCSLIAAGD